MEKYNYLFLITVWALPLIILQWLIGGDVLLRRWKVLVLGILIPTVYLTVMDSIALGSKTWTISPEQSTGIFFPVIDVPIEEGIFFLVTNTLVVQGLIFLMAFPFMLKRMRAIFLSILSLARRGPKAFSPDVPADE